MTNPFSTPDTSLRRDMMQAIQAHYYNITDAEDLPVGGLLVMLDRRATPVRAELHLFDETAEEAATRAIRQACHILADRYSGEEPLPLQIRESYVLGDSLEVELAAPGTIAPPVKEQFWSNWSWLMIGGVLGGLVLLIGLVMAIPRLFGGSSSPETTASSETATPAGAEGATQASGESAPAGQNTATLPPSVNANPDLAIGSRVRVHPGFTVSLQSQPSPDEAYSLKNYLGDQENETVEIVGGPQYTQGNTDTIVWWLVRLDDGSEAWAAANTSEQTLLEPVE